MKKVYLFDGSLIPSKYMYSEKELFDNTELYMIPSFRMPVATGYKLGVKGPTRVILINEDFSKLSHDQRLFALYHEVGHYECGHLDMARGQRNIKLEIEADIYATNRLIEELNITPSIAINIFIDTMITLGLNKKETNYRVNAMENYYNI